jgi:hypothetical protein
MFFPRHSCLVSEAAETRSAQLPVCVLIRPWVFLVHSVNEILPSKSVARRRPHQRLSHGIAKRFCSEDLGLPGLSRDFKHSRFDSIDLPRRPSPRHFVRDTVSGFDPSDGTNTSSASDVSSRVLSSTCPVPCLSASLMRVLTSSGSWPI